MTACDSICAAAPAVKRVRIAARGTNGELTDWTKVIPRVLLTSANSGDSQWTQGTDSGSELRLVDAPQAQTQVLIPNSHLLQDSKILGALTRLFGGTSFLELRNVDTDWLSGKNSLLTALNRFVDALGFEGHERPSLIVQNAGDYFAVLALSGAGEPIRSIIHG